MIDQKEIQRIKRLHATSNTCNANVDYLLSAVDSLQSQLEQLRAEHERLTKECDRAREDIRVLTNGRFIQS